MFTIVVATESTNSSLVGAWQSYVDCASPVKRDPEAKGCGEHTIPATLLYMNLPFTQGEGQVNHLIIHLEKNTHLNLNTKTLFGNDKTVHIVVLCSYQKLATVGCRHDKGVGEHLDSH